MKLTPCPQVSGRLTDALSLATRVFVDFIGDSRAAVRDVDTKIVVKWNKTLKGSFKPAGTRKRLRHFLLLDLSQTECKTCNIIYVMSTEKSFFIPRSSYDFLVAS